MWKTIWNVNNVYLCKSCEPIPEFKLCHQTGMQNWIFKVDLKRKIFERERQTERWNDGLTDSQKYGAPYRMTDRQMVTFMRGRSRCVLHWKQCVQCMLNGFVLETPMTPGLFSLSYIGPRLSRCGSKWESNKHTDLHWPWAPAAPHLRFC